jgi:hypothetical protein
MGLVVGHLRGIGSFNKQTIIIIIIMIIIITLFTEGNTLRHIQIATHYLTMQPSKLKKMIILGISYEIAKLNDKSLSTSSNFHMIQIKSSCQN